MVKYMKQQANKVQALEHKIIRRFRTPRQTNAGLSDEEEHGSGSGRGAPAAPHSVSASPSPAPGRASPPLGGPGDLSWAGIPELCRRYLAAAADDDDEEERARGEAAEDGDASLDQSFDASIATVGGSARHPPTRGSSFLKVPRVGGRRTRPRPEGEASRRFRASEEGDETRREARLIGCVWTLRASLLFSLARLRGI
uniref:Uncharacterized protein n=1 Tax=Oryza meridionalis TaxID=40149 RepID=A0A0E0C0H7_9ORYZ